MNTSTDFDRIAQDWLQDGPTELPDRTLQAALDEVHVTSQRRFGAARRTFPMNGNAYRLAAAAVVGLLIIVAGGIYLGNNGSGGVGAPAPRAPATVVPTVAPSATPAPTPISSPANLTPGQLCGRNACLTGPLDPGTYWFDQPGGTPAKVSFTVPAGWTNDEDGFVEKYADTANEMHFSTWRLTHVQADVCHHPAGTIVDAGTSIDELANVLVAQTGRVGSAATDVTLGGFPAKRIELTVPADLDLTTCDFGAVKFWPDTGGDESGGMCCVELGSTDVYYAVDVAGDRLVVVARHQAGSPPEDLAELQAIVDSIVIEPREGGSSPSPTP